jgi:hypothetical protein
MIVPQKFTGDDTAKIAVNAPKTWKYLVNHEEAFRKRASVIYKKRPKFSIFGVGEYTFQPWKVCVSGFYKQLKFEVISPKQGKPQVFDDTVYFLPFQSELEARLVEHLLSSHLAKEFFNSIVFWDEKRPITVERLSRLNLEKLANALGCLDRLHSARDSERLDDGQPTLFAASA